MTNMGEPERAAQASGEEEGRDPSRNSKALQAGRGGLGVGVEESSIPGEGPSAEGW